MTVRLLPYESADGPTNMASDEAILLSAVEGLASFRLYGWSSPTVSLGYFQPAAILQQEPLLATLPWVRRASGGSTLVHHHELTYALALPAYLAKVQVWMPMIHAILLDALGSFGLQVQPVVNASVQGKVLCFQKQTPGDLLGAGQKIVGSAQRKHRGCLLQHGAILLEQSEFTPGLPGIRETLARILTPDELGPAILTAFEKATGWRLSSSYWWPNEMEWIAGLVEDKYGNRAWSEKR